MKLTELDVLGKLLIWQKLVILGVLAFVMVAIPTTLYFNGQQHYIDTIIAERGGLEPANNVIALLKEVQKHRDLAFATLSGNQTAESNLKTAKADVDAQIAKTEKAFGSINYPGMAEAWKSFKDEWVRQASNISTKAMTGEKIWDAQTQLVGQIFSIQDLIMSGSTMDLDPDTETYYLIQVVMVNTPALAEKLAQARHYGHTALSSGTAQTEGVSQQDRLLLSGFAGRGHELITNTKNAIERAVKNFPELKARSYQKTLDTGAAAEQVFKMTESELIEASTVKFSATEFFNKYNQAIEQQFASVVSGIDSINKEFDRQEDATNHGIYTAMAIIFTILLLAALFAYLIAKSIIDPINYLVGVMNKLASGDNKARANMLTFDETGALGRQFDMMVDQRESLSASIQKENEVLNNSIIEILQSVARLAQRDLTVKAPVAEDITGPLGDALNLLSSETAKVLNQVVQIAGQVSNVSQQVKAQSDTVINIAGEENREVQRSAVELNEASEAMLGIANLALSCNDAAEKAIQNTDKAQETVLSTVKGITAIRDTIRETEKRIKRLGERSQEIGSVVAIINNIAERTHILALNASMHAASAGEAGKGFAVVANEVQKLAENAREATSQISGLVNNIQVETADTITTMNDAISQVVQGTTLAQQAGNEMRETRDTTADLVKLVQRIAQNSKAQAETTQQLRESSMLIQKSSAETYQQLQDQGAQTQRLVAFSDSLVESVGVFILPKSKDAALAA
jgi:twitching motility protein PilJ